MSPMLTAGIAAAVGLLVGWITRHNQAATPAAASPAPTTPSAVVPTAPIVAVPTAVPSVVASVLPQIEATAAPILENVMLQLIQQKLGVATATAIHGVLDQIVAGIVTVGAAPAPTPAPKAA